MKKTLKSVLRTVILACTMVTIVSFTAFAGEWKQDNVGWWYQYDDGGYPADTWKKINSQWYYFDNTGYMVANRWIGNYYLGADGAMLTDTITPDGYKVGADGAWIPDANKTTDDSTNSNTDDEELAMVAVSSVYNSLKNPESFLIYGLECKDLNFRNGLGNNVSIRVAHLDYSATNSYGGRVRSDYMGYYRDGKYRYYDDPEYSLTSETIKNAKNIKTIDVEALIAKMKEQGYFNKSGISID